MQTNEHAGYALERREILIALAGAAVMAGTISAQAETASTPIIYERDFSGFDGATLEQTVKLLADRAEIQELVGRYAHKVAHDLSVAELFTDDGAFISHQPGQTISEMRGRIALDRFYAELATGPTHPKPMLHNHLIDISGDDAIGICSLEVRQSINGESIIGSGYYDDKYRRVSGRWKFVTRKLTFFHYVPLSKGWSH